MSATGTIAQLFFDQANTHGQNTAFLYRQNKTGYQPMSWSSLLSLVNDIAFGLVALDLDRKATVAIFSPTSYLWTSCDLATIITGAVSVPLYPNSAADDIEYILNHCEAQVIFAAADLLPKLAEQHNKIDHCKKIIYLPSLIKVDNDWSAIKTGYSQIEDKLMHLNELRSLGSDLKANQPELIAERIQSISPDDTATIIYTSGTTGAPKGVPLTHRNILSLLEILPAILPVSKDDIYFSYLPISHVFERICGEFYWLFCGATCAFAESMENMPKNLGEVEPTLMLAVPRVLDRIYTKINNGIRGASVGSRRLIEWAIAVGTKVFHFRSHKQDVPPIVLLQHWLANELVLKKIRQRIGKRLRFIVTGGAPATAPVLQFFHAIGIPVLEGYGLTETAAPTNVNHLDYPKIGTVGPALPVVEQKLAEDGEILVRGSSIFKAYFKDPDATKESFVDDWFRTGDVGVIDANGYLKITDRKKDLIVNAAGKNIAPQRIEGLLRTISPISQVIVFGDKHKHLVALITVVEHAVTELANDNGWSFETFEELVRSTELQRYIKKEIAAKQDQLAEYEYIRRFAILPDELSVDSGELTASMKVKRNVIAKKFAKLIESLYQEDFVAADK